MRISDWSSDVCSSDLLHLRDDGRGMGADRRPCPVVRLLPAAALVDPRRAERAHPLWPARRGGADDDHLLLCRDQPDDGDGPRAGGRHPAAALLLWRLVDARSEEHTSELQSLMRISYAVFCLKKKKNIN